MKFRQLKIQNKDNRRENSCLFYPHLSVFTTAITLESKNSTRQKPKPLFPPFSACSIAEKGGKQMLEKYYAKVKGIVHRCRKDYYLHLWEKEDWDQEGMICLHELLEHHPELVKEEKKLYVYFKTKFRNRILDSVRKQESQKRRLDRMAYEEVGEISHRLPEGGLWLDDYYALHELLNTYRRKLPEDKQEAYERLWADERFKGRKALLRELKETLQDF